MSQQNRDLLVLAKRVTMNPDELEYEVERINGILRRVETANNYCVANEVIDLNRYKIIRKHYLIMRVLRENKSRPFVFICNKN